MDAEIRAKIVAITIAKIVAITIAKMGFPLRLTNKEKGISFTELSAGKAVIKLAEYDTKVCLSTLLAYSKESCTKLMKGWQVERLTKKRNQIETYYPR